MEESNVDLSDEHLDDHSDENSVSNPSLDPVTNNDKPSASFSETLYKETGIRKDTLDDLGGCIFPDSGYFTKQISNIYKVQMENGIWERLSKNVNSRGKKKFFVKGTWQQDIVNIIAKYNTYCSIKFKRHLVYQSEIRSSRTDLLFKADGRCIHDVCPITKITLTLRTDLSYEITFNSKEIKHKVGVTNSASVEYAKRINAKDKDVFVAGNKDSIGTSPSILKQIAFEGRISGRLSTSELDSIIRMKNKYIMEDATKSTVKGFIQTISVDPVILFLWTQAGIRIFHDLCKMDAVTWDATSKIVKTRLTEKKLFYYELTIRNPSTGHISLPVAVMISSDQTQPTVEYWMSRFRNDKKKYMEQADFHSLYKSIVIVQWYL